MQGCSCSGGASLTPRPTPHILEEVFVEPQGLREDSVPRDSGISPELLEGGEGFPCTVVVGTLERSRSPLIPHS